MSKLAHHIIACSSGYVMSWTVDFDPYAVCMMVCAMTMGYCWMGLADKY